MDKHFLDLYSNYLLCSFGLTTATVLSTLLDGAIMLAFAHGGGEPKSTVLRICCKIDGGSSWNPIAGLYLFGLECVQNLGIEQSKPQFLPFKMPAKSLTKSAQANFMHCLQRIYRPDT